MYYILFITHNETDCSITYITYYCPSYTQQMYMDPFSLHFLVVSWGASSWFSMSFSCRKYVLQNVPNRSFTLLWVILFCKLLNRPCLCIWFQTVTDVCMMTFRIFVLFICSPAKIFTTIWVINSTDRCVVFLSRNIIVIRYFLMCSFHSQCCFWGKVIVEFDQLSNFKWMRSITW